MIKNGFRPEIEMQASDRFTGALNSSQVVAQVLSAVLCLPSFGADGGRASSLPRFEIIAWRLHLPFRQDVK